MKEKLTKPKSVPLTARMISPVAKYFYQCTEETQRAIKSLSLSLSFTVIVCGAVFAASICQFCLHGNYRLFPFVFIVCGIFYYLLDKPIVFSDPNKHSQNKNVRIGIAIVLGLFNSMLIDSFYFADDIRAARVAEIKADENRLRNEFAVKDSLLNVQRFVMMNEIDRSNSVLTDKRDALNAEADGTGGSGHAGMKDIWKSKYQMYVSDSVSAAGQIAMKQSQIAKIDSSLSSNSTLLQNEIERLPEQYSQGINKSMELLHKVIWIEGNFTTMFMSILLLIITMLAELVPLISKGYYDISEYFEKSANQKDVKEKEATMVKNKEINLIGQKVVLDFKREEVRMRREHQESTLESAVEYNKMIHQRTVEELDRLQALDEKLKKKYPNYYESHIKPMIEQTYINIHNAAKAAITQQ